MSTRATATPNPVHSSCCDNLNSLPSLPPPIPGYRPSKPRAISTKTPSKLGKYMPAPTFFFNSSAFSYSSGDLLKESPRRQSVQVPIESATKLLEDYANYKKSQSKQSGNVFGPGSIRNLFEYSEWFYFLEEVFLGD